ncbi:MAG: hypothetical protein SPL80_04320 [Bacilli bacterium]|nr:hypothetical protein [Bacilli bacterium]
MEKDNVKSRQGRTVWTAMSLVLLLLSFITLGIFLPLWEREPALRPYFIGLYSTFLLGALAFAILGIIFGSKSAKPFSIVFTAISGLSVTLSVVYVAIFLPSYYRGFGSIAPQALLKSHAAADCHVVNEESENYSRHETSMCYDHNGKLHDALLKVSFTFVRDPMESMDSGESFFYMLDDFNEESLQVYSSGLVKVRANDAPLYYGISTYTIPKDDATRLFTLSSEVVQDAIKVHEQGKEDAKGKGDIDHFVAAMEQKENPWCTYRSIHSSDGDYHEFRDNGNLLGVIKDAKGTFLDYLPVYHISTVLNYNTAYEDLPWVYTFYPEFREAMISYSFYDDYGWMGTQTFHYKLTIEDVTAIINAVENVLN